MILTPQGDGDWSSSQILHYNCYSLAVCSHLSIGIQDAQPVGQVGAISLLQGLHHHMHITAEAHGFRLGIYDL